MLVEEFEGENDKLKPMYATFAGVPWAEGSNRKKTPSTAAKTKRRDVSEPETLYLWDLARRNKLTYRNYGEFVATVSAADVSEVNTRKPKTYPDLSATLTAFVPIMMSI